MKSAFLKFCPYIKTAINFVYLFMNNPVSVNFLYSLTDCNIDLIKLICYSESELFHCKKILSKNRQYFFMVYRIRAWKGLNFSVSIMYRLSENSLFKWLKSVKILFFICPPAPPNDDNGN